MTQTKETKVVAGCIGTRAYQLHLAWDNWRGAPPHRWDNHFSTSRPHPDIASVPRRPHPVPRDRDFDVSAFWSTRAAQPILYKHRSLATWDTVSQASKTLGESYPDSTGRQLRPWETLYCRSKLAQSLSTYNFGGTRFITLQCHLGRTWLHYMKVIPSIYHQMVSFLTKDGQIDLYDSQLAARQCYQIAREAGTSQEDASLPESSHARDQ
ncbi:hypothetical protein CK203_009056 [Vitis vinifera]|uniref:Uncharacterized protein n=1 Tax=Vitis vinifera TaxID=29760 RepID=A0A438K2E8_VITVI|nr:hypothetical protein CK203_009056 [Vitis vinifera]